MKRKHLAKQHEMPFADNAWRLTGELLVQEKPTTKRNDDEAQTQIPTSAYAPVAAGHQGVLERP